MDLTKHINKRNLLIIAFAFLLNFYYIIPQSIALAVNAVILVLSIHNVKKVSTMLPFKWYLSFVLIFTVMTLLRFDSTTYLISSINVCIIILTLILVLKSKIDIALFIHATSISGFLLCMYIYYKFGYLFGLGRLGMEMPGTRIDSAITLGYIFLYICCMQIYSMFEQKNITMKVMTIAAIVLTLYLTLLTGTRKALLIPIAYLFLCLYLRYKKNSLKLLIIIAISIFATTKVIGYIADNDILDKNMIERWQGTIGLIDNKQYLDDSSLERLDHIEKAKKLFYYNPIFGAGINNAIKYIGTHAHNNYLTLLAFGGIVLLLSYYWIYLYLIKKWKKIYNLYPQLYIMILMLLFSDMGTTSFNISYFNILITLLIIAYKIGYDKQTVNVLNENIQNHENTYHRQLRNGKG